MNTNLDFRKWKQNQYAEIQYTYEKNEVQQLHLISYWTMGNTLNLQYKGLLRFFLRDTCLGIMDLIRCSLTWNKPN